MDQRRGPAADPGGRIGAGGLVAVAALPEVPRHRVPQAALPAAHHPHRRFPRRLPRPEHGPAAAFVGPVGRAPRNPRVHLRGGVRRALGRGGLRADVRAGGEGARILRSARPVAPGHGRAPVHAGRQALPAVAHPGGFAVQAGRRGGFLDDGTLGVRRVSAGRSARAGDRAAPAREAVREDRRRRHGAVRERPLFPRAVRGDARRREPVVPLHALGRAPPNPAGPVRGATGGGGAAAAALDGGARAAVGRARGADPSGDRRAAERLAADVEPLDVRRVRDELPGPDGRVAPLREVRFEHVRRRRADAKILV